jgi:proteasome accessory factor C
LIDVSTEGGRIVISNADTIAAPLRLTRAEALTLTVALRALRGAEGVADSTVIERTLAKLDEAAASASGQGGPRVAAVLDDGSPESVRGRVAEALSRGRRVHLRYLVPARDESTERDVDPMRLVSLDGRWYLEGWCHRAEDTRLFRLDRVEEIRVLDIDGTPPEVAVARDLSAGTFVAGPNDHVVTLLLRRGWDWVGEYYPIESAVPAPEGSIITLRVGDTEWVRRPGPALGRRSRRAGPARVAGPRGRGRRGGAHGIRAGGLRYAVVGLAAGLRRDPAPRELVALGAGAAYLAQRHRRESAALRLGGRGPRGGGHQPSGRTGHARVGRLHPSL